MSVFQAVPRALLRVAVGMMVGVALAVFFATGALILDRQATGPWATRYAELVPLPAARVGKRFVLYRDVVDRWETVDRFLALEEARLVNGQLLRTRTELRQEAYEQLIRETHLAVLAEEQAFTIPPGVIEANVQNLLAQASTTVGVVDGSPQASIPTVQELSDYLLATFGWTFDEFQARILVPALREEGLAQQMMAAKGTTLEAWRADVDTFLRSEQVKRYLRF